MEQKQFCSHIDSSSYMVSYEPFDCLFQAGRADQFDGGARTHEITKNQIAVNEFDAESRIWWKAKEMLRGERSARFVALPYSPAIGMVLRIPRA